MSVNSNNLLQDNADTPSMSSDEALNPFNQNVLSSSAMSSAGSLVTPSSGTTGADTPREVSNNAGVGSGGIQGASVSSRNAVAHPGSRPVSRGSSIQLGANGPPRNPSTISASGFASSSMQNLAGSGKGSMVLYRLADPSSTHPSGLPSSVNPASNPQSATNSNRNSAASDSVNAALIPPTKPFGGGSGSNRSSVISFGMGYGEDTDSKYPSLRERPSMGAGYGFGGLSLTTAARIANAESQSPFTHHPVHPPNLPAPSPTHSPGLGNPRSTFGSGGSGSFPGTPTTPSSAPLPLNAPRGLIPYAYDPAVDSLLPDDDEDILHDPNASPEAEKRLYSKGGLLWYNGNRKGSSWSWRGVWNLGGLSALLLALIALFLLYPVVTELRTRDRNDAVTGNIRVNATGQAPVLPNVRELVDKDTPQDVRTRTGFDGEEYELVFSDEFNENGRTFWPGDDPFFEAMDFWYGVTQDLEWYDPQQVTTRDGSLIITMDTAAWPTPGSTPNSTAPFIPADNHNLTYRSAMLQSWNKLCFTSGYIEIAAIMPGPNGQSEAVWPGTWTMGNLGRPGYRATTDGMWPYSYDACDAGTFPNQTNKDQSGPAAALFSDASWPEYDKKLSVLTGQRLSSCSCPSSDHPGPWLSHENRYRGRGAPEIDIIEVQKDKKTDEITGIELPGNVNANTFTIYNTSNTYTNPYHGSPLQQAVSGLTKVPAENYQGMPNKRFVTYGFEYWADTNNRNNGFITWQVDGKPSVTLRPGAVPPDKGTGGSQVDQRLIPEEPMSIVMNLGISRNWQTINLNTVQFPLEMAFDYVRIYQRKGQTNIGCDPPDYPTADYINRHLDQYSGMCPELS
ncbi:beta-glucan synthesis-associated [Marasmius fiardii PR-910]|nr:beta-glucan synthesis-associated [Marasmius fiardii PR-910]